MEVERATVLVGFFGRVRCVRLLPDLNGLPL